MRLAVSTAIMLLASALTAGPACAMQAFIEALDGSYYTIEVEPTDRVEEVRVKVAEETGIPAEQIALVFADHELLDGSTLQDCGVKRDSVLHVVRRCLTVLVNGMPAAEAQMGQTIALLANWETSTWNADPVQASFYVGDPAEGRLLGTVAVQSYGNQRTALLEIELADGMWMVGSNEITVSLEAAAPLSAQTTLSVVAAKDPEPAPEPDPGDGGEGQTDSDTGGGADQGAAEGVGDEDDSVPVSGDQRPSDEDASSASTVSQGQGQAGALPATGDRSVPIVLACCCAGALLIAVGALKRR